MENGKLRALLFLAIIYPGFCVGVAVADPITNCKVSFTTTGEPNLVKIIGKSETDCEGSVSATGVGELKLKLDKLDTGVALRNKHLRENYLEVSKFPEAKLTISKVDGLADPKNGSGKFTADLELHGTKKAVPDGTYELKGGKGSATFNVDLPDWGIKRPEFMGVKVVDKVNVTVTFEH